MRLLNKVTRIAKPKELPAVGCKGKLSFGMTGGEEDAHVTKVDREEGLFWITYASRGGEKPLLMTYYAPEDCFAQCIERSHKVFGKEVEGYFNKFIPNEAPLQAQA